jgi:hypothetical protein
MSPKHSSIDRQVEVQVDRLVDEDAGQHPREEIERLASESASELEDAPLQQFVPNLVYNDVKGRLAEDAARSRSRGSREAAMRPV